MASSLKMAGISGYSAIRQSYSRVGMVAHMYLMFHCGVLKDKKRLQTLWGAKVLVGIILLLHLGHC